LDKTAQATAAVWMAKTAMVFEAVTPRPRWFYTQAERAEMMSLRAVPKNTLIWLGRNANSGSLFAFSRRMSNPIPQRNNRLAEGYVVTIGLDRLVLQLLALRSNAHHDMATLSFDVRPGPWRDSLIQIWPAEHATANWPPPSSFSATTTDLDALGNRFAT
jgi:hypothetical protein